VETEFNEKKLTTKVKQAYVIFRVYERPKATIQLRF